MSIMVIEAYFPVLYNTSMNEVNKVMMKKAGVAVVDTAAGAVDAAVSGGYPVASGAWALSKAFYGAAMELRKKKVGEWEEMMNNNPSTLTEQLFESEERQDAFATSLESYIKERDSDKRVILRTIFLDYASNLNPEQYPLERLYEITRQITFYEAKILSQLISELAVSNGQSVKATPENIESVLHLISLGLLIEDTTPVIINPDAGGGPRLPKVFHSNLGKKYAEFVSSSESE